MGNVEEQPWGEVWSRVLVILSGIHSRGKWAKLTPPIPLSWHEASHCSSTETNKGLTHAITKRHQMLARRVERMCKYIFKCVLVCSFLPLSFYFSPPSLPLLWGSLAVVTKLCSSVGWSIMVLFFSLTEEKTQLVLNVDKQLEEVRELVCLWSVIFSFSHFLNYEFVARGGEGGAVFTATRQLHLYYPGADMTCRHVRTSHGGKEASSSHDYFPVICF